MDITPSLKLLLYDRNSNILDSTDYIVNNVGKVVIPELTPNTQYNQGEFFVSWVVGGAEMNKSPVPAFKTLKYETSETVMVYFNDINKDNLERLKGDSTYQIWLQNGNQGNVHDFLDSLKGEKGDSAYQVWLQNGNQGSMNDFLVSLKGEKGDSGLNLTQGGSAYEYALNNGFKGNEEEWLKSLKGEKGEPFTYSDFTKEQLDSLKGEKGEPFTYNDFTQEQLENLKGEKGEPFKYSDFTKEQLDSLKGEKGEKGEPFKYSDFTKEQLESLKGEKGEKGDTPNLPYINVMDLGVVADGVTDDTKNLQKALVYCKDNNAIAVLNKSVYITDTININCMTLMPSGTIIANVEDKPAVIYGNESGYTKGHNSILPNISAKVKSWDKNTTGLKIVNVIESKLSLGEIKNFDKGVKLTATSNLSLCYNQFEIGSLINNKINMYLCQESNGSWINENQFSGGRFAHYSNEGKNRDDVFQIVTEKPDTNPYLINNNLWIKPSIEGEVAKIGVKMQGVYNTLFNARFEKK